MENKNANKDTWFSLQSEVAMHKNELVIAHHTMYRLHDVIYCEDDYYWIYDPWCGFLNQDKPDNFLYSSCVGDHLCLKDYLPKEKYDQLVNEWNCNNKNQAI